MSGSTQVADGRHDGDVESVVDVEESVSGRPLRADARRNRDKLVATAAELFEQRGVDVPMDEIARTAGVGIGTLYRHFPTRDAVVEAVYRREVELLTERAEQLVVGDKPDEALATWMLSFSRYVVRKRGMVEVLRGMVEAGNEMFAESRQRIDTAIRLLVDRAVAAGTIRSDADPDDILRALGGICMAVDAPGWEARTHRLCNLLMDGLRYGAPHPGGS